MREQPGIPEEQLRACLQEQYGLSPVTLEFLPRAKDYNAGVYRAVSEQGTAYLLKVTSRSLYEPRCLVPRYLTDQRIPSVVAPLPTRSNAFKSGENFVSPYRIDYRVRFCVVKVSPVFSRG
jgi:spectinomycin phosphotransferase